MKLGPRRNGALDSKPTFVEARGFWKVPPSRPMGMWNRAGDKIGMPMSEFRIALANLQFPATTEESIALAEQAIAQASIERGDLICFPECFIPGYRGTGKLVPPPDAVFLERAWSVIAAAAAKANLAVVLGTERIVDGVLLITALVVNRDGTLAGFQDKVQLDPTE